MGKDDSMTAATSSQSKQHCNLFIKWGIILIPQILLFLAINFTGNLVYATNDDTTMLAICSGGYGTPSAYIINMHMLVGYILKILFTAYPHVNWLTVFFLSVIFLSQLVLDYVLLSEKDRYSSIIWRALILDMAFVLFLDHFSFTTTAYYAGSAGLIAALRGLRYPVKKQRIWIFFVSFVLLCLGAMIRAEVYKSLLIIFFGAVAYEYLLLRDRRPLIIALLAAFLVVLSVQSHTFWMNRDPVEKAFYAWGETRSAALDSAFIPYVEAEFSQAGISENQYNAIYNAFYYHFDAVNTDVMQAFLRLNHIGNKYNFDIAGFFPEYLREYHSRCFMGHTLFGIAALLYFLITDRKGRLFVAGSYLLTVGTQFLFWFIKRSIYRVTMPNYVFAVLLILLYCDVSPKILKAFKENHISFGKAAVSATALLCIVGALYTRSHDWRYAPIVIQSDHRSVSTYMDQHKDTVYMAGDIGVFAIGMADSVWESPSRTSHLIGNWETYSLPYFELMESIGVKNPYDPLAEAIDNDKILLLTRHNDQFPEKNPWMIPFIKECTGVDVHFELVDDLTALNPSLPDNWATYKIVRDTSKE